MSDQKTVKKRKKRAVKKDAKKSQKKAPKKTAKKDPAEPPSIPSKQLAVIPDVERIDQNLAESARAKFRAGKEPTYNEKRALKRIEKSELESIKWKILKSISRADWRLMSGQTDAIINRHIARHGMPIAGKYFELPALARWIHNFVEKNLNNLRGFESDEVEIWAGGDKDSPSLERLRTIKGDLAELDLKEKRGELLSREKVHRSLVRIASVLRSALETLLKHYGNEAFEIMAEPLEDMRLEVKGSLGDDLDE